MSAHEAAGNMGAKFVDPLAAGMARIDRNVSESVRQAMGEETRCRSATWSIFRTGAVKLEETCLAYAIV